MNQYLSKYAGVIVVSGIVVGGIASAAIVSLPSFGPQLATSPTPTPTPLETEFSESDFYNKLIQSINILDTRTNGTQSFDAGNQTISKVANPTQPSDAATKNYVDTQIEQQKKWETVSLKTTENFNPKCEYVIQTAKNAFRATHVQADELKYVEAWGSGEYQAAWISPLKKTVLHNDISRYYDDVLKTNEEKVVSIQKQCL